MNPFRALLALLLVLLLIPLSSGPAAAVELIVYSERKPPLIEPILKAYTEATGVELRLLSDSAAVLIERLAAEGEHTRADLLLTVDAGNLWQAAERGLLSKLDSVVLKERVPAHLRDPEGQWFGLTRRARTVVYNPELIQPEQLSTYAALGDPVLKGKLCLRSSRKVYNQSLVATLIDRLGAEQAEVVVQGWVNNLAAPPFADDTLVIQAVAAGQCGVGLVNTYYYGRLLKEDPALKARLFWADQGAGGVHVNLSGAGLTRHGKHPAEAQALLEWLSGPQAQALFATVDFEYPVLAGTELAPEVQAWGAFEEDHTPLVVAGKRQREAVELMDRVGWR